MKALFINCCIREEESRTLVLAKAFIEKLQDKYPKLVVDELRLMDEELKPLLYDDIKKRDKLIASNSFNDEMFKYASGYKDNDIIIIATPYWDLSFPSLLKVYIEKLFVNNLTFKYVGSDFVGLCKTKKLMVLGTSGGAVINNNFNYIFDVVNALASKKVKCFYSYVNMLDVVTEQQVKGNLNKAINDLDIIISEF